MLSKGRRCAVFIVVAAMLLMGSIDQTAVASALPVLQADLGAPLSWAGWTVSIYMVGQIVALPLAGTVGDRFGRRRVFLTAVATFTVASVLSGLAPTIETMIGSRLLQGLSAGAFLPSAIGIVSELFGPGRDRVVASFNTIMPIGAILGPMVGGLVVAVTGWRAIFLVNIPVGVAVVVAGSLLLPRSSTPRTGRIDVLGAALLVVVLVGAILAVTLSGARLAGGGDAVRALAPAGLSMVAFGLLVRHLGRCSEPLVPLHLVRGPTFRTLHLVNFLFGVAALGQASLVPWYAITRYGMDALTAGSLLTFRGVGAIIASALRVVLLRRLGFRPLLVGGSALVGAGLLILAAPTPAAVAPCVWIALATTVFGVGMGFAAPASSNAGLHLAPDRASSVAGLRGMFRLSGGIAGITVLTAATSGSADPAGAQANGYVVLAVVVLLSIALVLRLPNQAGRW